MNRGIEGCNAFYKTVRSDFENQPTTTYLAKDGSHKNVTMRGIRHRKAIVLTAEQHILDGANFLDRRKRDAIDRHDVHRLDIRVLHRER